MKKKQDWRTHDFQIKNGFLKYIQNKTIHDELDLSQVVCVTACPSRDNKSLFHFEIHFSGYKGSPWLLRAQTQDDRTCWMEAIQPGSSTVVGSPTADAYETISPLGESGAYSDATHVPYKSQPPSVAIYDEPDVKTNTQIVQVPPAPVEYDEPFLALARRDNIYCNVPGELEEDSYIEVVQADRTAPATIPKELASIAEISLENLADLDQKEAQLWMRLHMQKMVQKTELVYDSVQPLSPKADKQPTTKPKPPVPAKQYSKAKATTPPSSPPPEAIEEISNDEIGHNIELEKATEAGREDLYINLDTISEIITEVPPPPIPPRTYQRVDDHEEVDSNKNQSQTLRHRQMPTSSSPAQSQQSRTLPPHWRSKSYPILSQDIQAPQHQSQFLVQQQAFDSMNVPRIQSQEEMISTLKASNRAISSDIASHLVTDDDGSYCTVGKRPEWAKAKTQTFGLEPSLADLHQKALFLPRATLRDLEEIGDGQYGKVFKGNYKRFEGPGYPVAVKMIKQYESEKEKDGFLKEMNVMSKLMHPNIVRLFGLVQQEEPWIVLEYLPHGDLKKFLKKNKKPTEKLIKYMLDVATGMHYISEKGLVHRDLAARNVMVSQDEICKVGDFGLLRELPKDDEIYVAKTKVALPTRWMAPESLMKKEFSPASDVWSFGVVMWEMYNPALMPYKGMNNTQVAVGVNHELRLHIPEAYPATVVRIMKACWQHSPSKRPSFLLIASLLTNVYFGSE